MNLKRVAIPPGETVSDLLEYHNISRTAFGKKIGMNEYQVKNLLKGNMKITPELAEKLNETIGGDTQFWLNLEAIFRKDVADGYPIRTAARKFR